jgi:PleD family two-component response regulator
MRRAVREARTISATELAAFCRVDLKTIHNWCARRKIPHTRTEGRRLRFRPLDVVDFMRAYELPLPEALRHARPRVVLVEREAPVLEAMERALARTFEVIARADAVEALLRLAADDPDVIVLGDVTPLLAPGLSARLRASDVTRHVRVVMVGPRTGDGAAVARGDGPGLRDALARLTGQQ